MKKSKGRYIFQIILELAVVLALTGFLVYSMMDAKKFDIVSVVLLVILFGVTGVRITGYIKAYSGKE